MTDNNYSYTPQLTGTVTPPEPEKKKSKAPLIIIIILAALLLLAGGGFGLSKAGVFRSSDKEYVGTWFYDTGSLDAGSVVFYGNGCARVDNDKFRVKFAGDTLKVMSDSDVYELSYAANGGLMILGDEDARELFGSCAGDLSDSDYGIVLHRYSTDTYFTAQELMDKYIEFFGKEEEEAISSLFTTSNSDFGSLFDLFGGASENDSLLGGLGDLFDLFGGGTGSSEGAASDDFGFGNLFGGLFDGLLGGEEENDNPGTNDSLGGLGDLFDFFGSFGNLFGTEDDTDSGNYGFTINDGGSVEA